MTQPHYAPYQPPRVRQRGPTGAGPIVALVIGLVLLIVGPVGGLVVGAFAMIPPAIESAGHVASVSPSATLELRRDGSVYLMVPAAAVSTAESGMCMASAAGSARLPVVAESAGTFTTRIGDERYTSFARVTATEAGPVTITCAGVDAPVMTVPALSPGMLLRPFAWWAFGGAAAGVVGIVLLVVGIVGLVRRPGPRAA